MIFFFSKGFERKSMEKALFQETGTIITMHIWNLQTKIIQLKNVNVQSEWRCSAKDQLTQSNNKKIKKGNNKDNALFPYLLYIKKRNQQSKKNRLSCISEDKRAKIN